MKANLAGLGDRLVLVGPRGPQSHADLVALPDPASLSELGEKIAGLPSQNIQKLEQLSIKFTINDEPSEEILIQRKRHHKKFLFSISKECNSIRQLQLFCFTLSTISLSQIQWKVGADSLKFYSVYMETQNNFSLSKKTQQYKTP